MALHAKRFDEPDEVLDLPHLHQEVVVLGELHVARVVHEPGWSWEEHVKPIVRTESCHHHHQGVLLSGQLEFRADGGARRLVGAGEAYDVPPGHTARVVGEEPAVAIEFTGVRGWGRPPEGAQRVVATVLVTDIVDSTAAAARLGDARWGQVLDAHKARVRRELERFGGRELTTTGDGFIATFDSASRALAAADAIRASVAADGLQVRIGVHSGEVERDVADVRGLALHTATRVAGLAGAGEVLVSAPAAALLEGAGFVLEDAGEHELKGLPGPRRLHRLAG